MSFDKRVGSTVYAVHVVQKSLFCAHKEFTQENLTKAEAKKMVETYKRDPKTVKLRIRKMVCQDATEDFDGLFQEETPFLTEEQAAIHYLEGSALQMCLQVRSFNSQARKKISKTIKNPHPRKDFPRSKTSYRMTLKKILEEHVSGEGISYSPSEVLWSLVPEKLAQPLLPTSK